jgi:hypothetical protein
MLEIAHKLLSKVPEILGFGVKMFWRIKVMFALFHLNQT